MKWEWDLVCDILFCFELVELGLIVMGMVFGFDYDD